MIKNVYSIYDIKGQYYQTPFYCENHEVAKRGGYEFVNEPNGRTTPQKFPEDFQLFWIATFDDHSGRFVQLPNNEFIAQLSDFKTKNPGGPT